LKKERSSGFGKWGYPIAGPAVYFPESCTDATPQALRDLMCPDPWSVLGIRRPRIRPQTLYTQRIPSSDLHALDWKNLALPGAACGSSRPIRPRHTTAWEAEAFIHTDVDLLWWNPVLVSSWSRPVFGDLDGDGRDEAGLDVVCANGGGMAAGQLAFSEVIFKAAGRSLRVVGILTPRQPLRADVPHVPLLGNVHIEQGRVTAAEAWYGPYDGTCCPSGTARTTWTFSRGELRPKRTTILQKPWTSPLRISDVLAEPGQRELLEEQPTRIGAAPNLRFVVILDNESLEHVTKRHVKVTLTVRSESSRIVRTKTVDRIPPWPSHEPVVVFRNLGRLPVATKGTVTIYIHDPGAHPLHYPVSFIRG
jgi:hypothetical protein